MSNSEEKWLKAAVIGSLWGASEIVLGSFLHNLRIPFSGNILTAIGIVLMVSGHRLWPQTGILIRAGLICAALKTLSPSPVILGPMLSIIMQATLMESAVFLGRGTKASYITGGGLAVSWNLAYRIFSGIVLYGGSLIALYQNLIDYISRQTGLETGSYWLPLIILWALFFLWGAVAGAAGIYISNMASGKKPAFRISDPGEIPHLRSGKTSFRRGKLAGMRPMLVFILLVAGLYSISEFKLPVTLPLLAFFLIMLYIYDKRIIYRLFRKRALWIAMSIMMILSGFFLGPKAGFSTEGLKGGIEMVMRAIYVIGGFALISSELQRPEITRLIRGKTLSPLMNAVRIAFHATPALIDSLPQGREWRRPARVLSSMAGSMEHTFELMKRHNKTARKIFIISGKRGEGKSTFVSNVNRILRSSGVDTGGLIAPAYFEKGIRTGYMARSAGGEGLDVLLCSQVKSPDKELPGSYQFKNKAIEYGEELLSPARNKNRRLVIIDEVGPYELKGMGWDNALEKILSGSQCNLLLVVRESLTDRVIDKYRLNNPVIIRLNKYKPDQVAATIKEAIDRQGE